MIELRSRLHLPKSNYVMVGMSLVGLLIAAYAWVSTPWYNAMRTPSMVRYCIKYQQPVIKEAVTNEPLCLEQTTLKIPPSYYGLLNWADDSADGSVQRLYVAYPSMQPWSTLSWFEKRHTQKISIILQGISWKSARETFDLQLHLSQKPMHLEPLYGLDQYQYLIITLQRRLLGSFELNTNVVFDCTYSSDPILNELAMCAATHYTDWHLMVEYWHQRSLLPEWRKLDTKVHALIESFVVTP
jgi:hypothetical protein